MTLTATVLPEYAIDKTVTWTTSDAAIATVDAEGNVSALSEGEAIITATCGDKSATCKVTVSTVLADSIILDKTELSLKIGESGKLTATVLPEDVTDKTVTWSTSATFIADIDNEGNVTAVSAGEAIITATCGDKSATCKVTVNPIPTESIILDKTELSLTIGETATLTATVLPKNATNRLVTWSISDLWVVWFLPEGNKCNVRASFAGETIITATCGNVSATCKVTVNPIPVESITLDKSELSLKIGESGKLTATVLPEDVTDKTVAWTSSDTDIATVDREGNVTAVSEGEATITAKCGDKSATCIVTVENSASGIVFIEDDDISITVNGTELLIDTASPDVKVTIIRQDGAVVYSGNNKGSYSLMRGLYVVVMDNVSRKVVIN